MRWLATIWRGLLEPEDGQAGEHPALVGDRRRVDGVVGGDPVAGDHQQPPVLRPVLVRRSYISRTFPLAMRGRSASAGHVARCYQRARAAAALRRSRPAATTISPGVADVVAVVEDRVEVEPGGAVVGGEQLAQRDALVPGPLGELLDDPVGVVAAERRPRRGRAGRAGRTARRGSARGSRACARASTVMPSTSAMARCCM